MSRIRSHGTRPEVRLRALLERWLPDYEVKEHPSEIFGKPDFYVPELRLAIFVDGCFFHGCPQHYRPPEQNKEYWLPKIRANKKRDRLVNRTLRAEGIWLVRIWEHELKGKRIKGRERIRRRVRYAQQKMTTEAPVLRLVAEEPAAYGSE